MPEDPKRKFNSLAEFPEPEDETYRNRLLHLIQLNTSDMTRSIAEIKNNGDTKDGDHADLIFKRLYGETGIIANLVMLRRNPFDPRSYRKLPVKPQNIEIGHQTLSAARKIDFGPYDLPGLTLSQLDDTSRAFYQFCQTQKRGERIVKLRP